MKEHDCEQCAEHLAGWKRALADYDNLKKQMDEDRGAARKAAKEDMVHALLPVLDNFDAAVKFQPEGLDAKASGWLSGILHVRGQLEEVLKELGAEPFGAVGETFDPTLHQAVAEKQESEQNDQTILEITQRGWRMGETVIRPASAVINNLN